MPMTYNDRDIISLPNANVIVDPITHKRCPIGVQNRSTVACGVTTLKKRPIII